MEATTTGIGKSGRRRRAIRLEVAARAVAAVMATAVLSLAGAALAQDQDETRLKAGIAAWKLGGCTACHGTYGGGGEGGAMPAGPSLRQSRLTQEQMLEVVSCGRPGTLMPFNLGAAYKETSCYGLPVGEVPDGAQAGASLSNTQLDDLVNYLFAKVVGQGDVTLEECGLYYGSPDSPFCASYH